MARYIGTATVELTPDDLDDLEDAAAWIWHLSDDAAYEDAPILRDLSDRIDAMRHQFRRALQ